MGESARMEEQILQIIKDEDRKNPLTDEEIASRLQVFREDVTTVRREAAEGGPIALVRDGDRITVDLSKDYLHLEVSDEEMEARRREWKAVTRPREKGLLGRYARLVSTARSGAALSRE